jgi:hypothetical protein
MPAVVAGEVAGDVVGEVTGAEATAAELAATVDPAGDVDDLDPAAAVAGVSILPKCSAT